MRIIRFLALILVLGIITGCVTDSTATDTQAQTEEQKDQLLAQQIVDRARTTVETLTHREDIKGARESLAQAKGVMIFPQLVKGAFLLGGEGGTGIVLVRQADGSWGYPAFYNMIGGSFGLQLGIESTEAMFLIMTQKGLDSILKNQMKLGADASVALGPLGIGLGAGKTAPDLAADIYVYSKTSGLFGGGALKGAAIDQRKDLNQAYYMSDATAQQILLNGQYSNSYADDLRASLSLVPVLNNKAVPITPVHQY